MLTILIFVDVPFRCHSHDRSPFHVDHQIESRLDRYIHLWQLRLKRSTYTLVEGKCRSASLLFATVARAALCKRMQDTELRLDTAMIYDAGLIKSYEICYSTLLSFAS